MMLKLLKEKEYKDFTKEHNAHFLQSYEWGKLSKTTNFEPFYVGMLDDSNNICATALLLKRKLPIGFSYFYIPRGYTIDYKNYKLIKNFTELIKDFVKSHKALFFKIDPDIKLHTIDKDANSIMGDNNYRLVRELLSMGFKRKKLTKYFETNQPRYTFRINLEDSMDEIEKKFSSTTRQRIRKAIKCGVKVEVGDKKDLKYFLKLIRETEKRQNFYSHTEKFYNDFYDTFAKNNNVTLYLGKVNVKNIVKKYLEETKQLEDEFNEIKLIDKKSSKNKLKEIEKIMNTEKEQLKYYNEQKDNEIVVSAYLTVRYGNKSWALYAANDMNYKRLYANYLVYQAQIENEKKKGSKIFDVFGTIGDPNSNSPLVGLHEFKKKWGGEYTEFIGEFDYVIRPFSYILFNILIPIKRKIVKHNLRKRGKK